MSVACMRTSIRKVYDTDTWRYRVDHMKDSQVIAVYYSFLHRGLLKG